MAATLAIKFALLKHGILGFWADGWSGRILLVMTALVLVLGPVAVWKAPNPGARWRDFAATHHCKKVAQVRGGINMVPGVAFNSSGKVGFGMGLEIEDDKSGWLCDDGVTYWR